MREETKRKISEAQKGKRTGPRGPHGDRATILDFNVERDGDRVSVEVFNDIGGRSLATFSVSALKALHLGEALIAAGNAGEEPAALVGDMKSGFRPVTEVTS